ncbi:HTTM domain-containing protein [Marinilongibacter aquaticus]|uniref:HTTM domain-containing protein n=1 Tax=Marinilongibacter aquaticus TaxID=2975157 RepID=UPI0021BDA5F2|nr:HTTM domain-containing protein [Marinilongibacter aquaticus]UBM57941.1 HTTM domain-containing protein [Marinilongibacter aquaticus]
MQTVIDKLGSYLNAKTSAAPLAAFRFIFGLMMCISLIRFWANGWIEKLYIEPSFHFHYYGFAWVRPFGPYTYLLFVVCGLAALAVALGYFYRLAITVFFLSFTYIELLDKTTYLNHYYFISCVSFLLLFLPAASYFSLDAKRQPKQSRNTVKKWHIDSIKLLLGLVYFYAGIAKIQPDWLYEALPLKIWLPSKFDIPVLGFWLQKTWVAYFFSWAGMLYDICIPFLLLNRRTRPFAFLLVVVFHVLTRILFPIGMFPFIMIVSTLIFFEPAFHEKLLHRISERLRNWIPLSASSRAFDTPKDRLAFLCVGIFMLFQILFPFRYLGYPGKLFWNEEGYRFSWRVMLMEKTGLANFKVFDKKTNKGFYIHNQDFLTVFQEKQMSTQADFMLEFAHYLGDYYKMKGIEDPAVYLESYVSLNGKGSRQFADPNQDLLLVRDSFQHKNWILSFDE